jgi:site-specific DNA-methyltransferase (adenine-specific)
MTYILFERDCVEMLQSLESNSVDLTLTDIPYNHVNRSSNGLRSLDKADADILTFDLEKFSQELFRVTKGSIYIFCEHFQLAELGKIFDKLKCSMRVCTWEKTNPSPMNGQHIWLSSTESCLFIKKPGATFNEHCQSAVWRESVERAIKDHPTPKPVLLMKRLIEASSNPNDIVFDPCMGSGSVGLACKMTDRTFWGCDINPEYVTKAKQRIDELNVNDNPWLRKLQKRNV